MKLDVIIADDHKLFSEGLKSLLKTIPPVSEIYVASNGEEVLKLLEKETADIIFMDISMPVMDGIESTKAVKRIYPDIKIIAITMMGDQSSIVKMFKAGADGYLLKNINFKEVEMAIRDVMSGRKYYTKEVSDILLDKIMNRTQVKRAGPYNDELSDREREIIRLICQSFTSKEISDILNISVKTVESHRSHIFSKLNIDHLVDLIYYALDNGIVSRPGNLE